MIVDSHTHLGTFPAIEGIAASLRTRTDVAGWRTRYPDIYEQIKNQAAVDNADSLLEAMDRHGVVTSLVQPTIGVTNEQVHAMASRHAGRMVFLAHAVTWPWDGRMNEGPDTGDAGLAAAQTAQDAIQNLGAAGIGETGARAVTRQSDPVLIARDFGPLMECLEPSRLPIQFPTGWTQFPGNLIYQDPLWVDELASRHNTVPIILTKMGRGLQRFFDAALAVALRNRNVYFDLVGTSPEHLRIAMEMLGPERLMFGTDWTYVWKYLSPPGDVHSASIALVESVTKDSGVREQIFSGTAASLFDLATV